jgi:hypothetical protein
LAQLASTSAFASRRRGGCRPPAPFGWGSPTYRIVTSDVPRRSAAPTVGSPSHAGSPFRPSFAGLGRHHRSARTARPRACLRHGTETAQDVFHRRGPRSCDRGGGLDANGFECAFVFRHLFACCDGIHSRPTTWISASRYPARSRTPCGTRARWAGKMLLTDFCNLPLTRAPACIARLPRWPPLARLPRPMERAPADDSSHGAFDDAPRASTDAYSAFAQARGRAPQNPGGLPIGRALEGCSSVCGIVLRRRSVGIDL